jgi:hypothetical protein
MLSEKQRVVERRRRKNIQDLPDIGKMNKGKLLRREPPTAAAGEPRKRAGQHTESRSLQIGTASDRGTGFVSKEHGSFRKQVLHIRMLNF